MHCGVSLGSGHFLGADPACVRPVDSANAAPHNDELSEVISKDAGSLCQEAYYAGPTFPSLV